MRTSLFISFSILLTNFIAFSSPFFFKHPFLGCPEDSICTKPVGEKIKKWNKGWRQQTSTKQQNHFVSKHGFPFSFYYQENVLSPRLPYALWNSKCLHHKKHSIYKGLGIIKQLEQLKLPLQGTPLIILKKNQELLSFTLPLDFTVLKIVEQKVFGLIEYQNNFYKIVIDSMGHFIFEDNKNLSENSRLIQDQTRVSCPKKLLAKPEFKNYFLDRYCYQIKDGSETSIAMQYWSCP